MLGSHLFVADGSRIFDVDEALAQDWDRLLDGRDADEVWALLGLDGKATRRWIDERPTPIPPLSSVSLNVAQACNMACGYCYADEGRFGGKSRLMSSRVARQVVDNLIAEAEPGSDLLVGFMGGEPLLNRDLLHELVPYAFEHGEATGHRVRFSITTNATLITPADAQVFSRYPFCVQISIDGPATTNDRQRPMRDGGGSYERILRGIKTLKQQGGPRQLSARVTVTRRSGELLPILDHLIGLGFDDVGLAVVLVSQIQGQEMEDFDKFLESMVDCGRKCLSELKAGRNYPFSNFLTAMEEIHRGSHRPYPCGAGAAYLSANAEGRLYACHRLVDDNSFAMGDVWRGSDREARLRHLRMSHVDRMHPCQTCWARYLCGGGCYHEVLKRGRVGCNYIRGWLDFCLGAYAELSTLLPHGQMPRRDDWALHGNLTTLA
jgi:uncharacterized protein